MLINSCALVPFQPLPLPRASFIGSAAPQRLAVPWYPFNLCFYCVAGLPVDDWIEKAKWPGHHDFIEEVGTQI